MIEFGNQVRRARATPGGGSVAAALGSFGAGLVCMVTGLSLSGRKFAGIKEEMLEHRHACEYDRGVLMDLIEKDSEAFDVVMTAMKAPAETAADKKKKEAALETTTIEAAKIPLSTMQHSFNAMTHAKVAAEKGNINAITDAGVAAHALMAAMEGAALNVRINLGNIASKSFTDKAAKDVEKLLSEGAKLKSEVLENVEARMKELAESS